MKLEYMISGEKVLWGSGTNPAVLYRAKAEKRIRISAGVCIGIFAALLIAAFINQELIPLVILLGCINMMLCAAVLITQYYRVFRSAEHRYCITENGIYAQSEQNGKDETVCIRFEELLFHWIDRDDNAESGGTVVCEYPEPATGKKAVLRLESLLDYQYVYDLIADRKAAAELPEDSFSPEQLLQDSVAELQTELFGAEPVRSEVFPDPSVNPLPELKEQPGDPAGQQVKTQAEE